MNTQEPKDYHTLLTDLIRKQMLILGPSFPLMQVRLIKGLTIAENGIVLETATDPKLILKELITQFFYISETLVELSMKPMIYSSMGKNYGDEFFSSYKKPTYEHPDNDHEQSRL